jgi:hypothetical protein
MVNNRLKVKEVTKENDKEKKIKEEEGGGRKLQRSSKKFAPTCTHAFMSCICVEMNVHVCDHSLEEFMSYATTS